METLPSNYILEKFYTSSGGPSYNRHTKAYNASCPVCREGKSWLKKKRLFYYPDTNSFYCFNCTKSWNSYTWLYQVTGMTKEEIFAEVHSGSFSRDISSEISNNKKPYISSMVLPHDSINLLDNQQQIFYGTDKNFQRALEYISIRKLDTAINKSRSYFISLTDNFHRNRLCIPYYDFNGKIVFYQTRALDGIEPRYLGKFGSDKSLFGIDRLDTEIDALFLFEGALDAIFVRNGLGVAGLTLTDTQNTQLQNFPFHKRIWVLDNPKFDQAAKENITKLLLNRECVFKWPDVPFKDFNDWAVADNLTEIDYKFVLQNLY